MSARLPRGADCDPETVNREGGATALPGWASITTGPNQRKSYGCSAPWKGCLRKTRLRQLRGGKERSRTSRGWEPGKGLDVSDTVGKTPSEPREGSPTACPGEDDARTGVEADIHRGKPNGKFGYFGSRLRSSNTILPKYVNADIVETRALCLVCGAELDSGQRPAVLFLCFPRELSAGVRERWCGEGACVHTTSPGAVNAAGQTPFPHKRAHRIVILSVLAPRIPT
ncbi:dihydropyrimidinase-related protein 1-like protein [Lates japonicus]|uniref:Dihydropyrimidinase-related protein 1-like protein n=1 Tax=Lates japonicus TaxID=270547 RepID=A0AAD3N613_LATJO|nr:dihydropyrimidinase-related protein 1-like protein [Lates japonicus]